jgi:hypothetical protein
VALVVAIMGVMVVKMMMMMAAMWMKKKLTTRISFSLCRYFFSPVCTAIIASRPVR